jgi:hypothetical protein
MESIGDARPTLDITTAISIAHKTVKQLFMTRPPICSIQEIKAAFI